MPVIRKCGYKRLRSERADEGYIRYVLEERYNTWTNKWKTVATFLDDEKRQAENAYSRHEVF